MEPLIFSLAPNGHSSAGVVGTTPSGLPYVYFIENLAEESGKKPIGIFAVTLPFLIHIHLLGIAKVNSDLGGLALDHASMHTVQLEGNYSSIFTLYVANDDQTDARYVLDPAAMEYSIDFCSAYTWEIIGNTLYFANDGPLPNMEVVDDFVREITPAHAIGASVALEQKPQTNEELAPESSNLHCPICQTPLHAGRRWLACPAGHGYLLKVEDLLVTRRHMNDEHRAVKQSVGALPSVITPITITPHGDLTCPYDSTILVKDIYQETTAYLYSCSTCPYRWIDGQDLDIILGKYRNDGEDNEENSEDHMDNPGNFLMHDVDTTYLRF